MVGRIWARVKVGARVRLEAATVVDAPASIVFRFFQQLDHLRLLSAGRRREWCLQQGALLAVGVAHEVRIQQGRHSLLVHFKTLRLDPHRLIEDEFLSWPLKGARRVLALEPQGAQTRVCESNVWDPPWYARGMVEKHEAEQRQFFVAKLNHAKQVIEAVYGVCGADAFLHGVLPDAVRAGLPLMVPLDPPAPA